MSGSKVVISEVLDVSEKEDTLTSSPLRWFSIVTNVALTLSVLDRDPDRSGSTSVMGAVPNNVILYNVMSVLVFIQCVAYIFVCQHQIKRLNRSNVECCPRHESRGRVRTFNDFLKKNKALAYGYWLIAIGSCTCSIVNSLMLIFHHNIEPVLDDVSYPVKGNLTVNATDTIINAPLLDGERVDETSWTVFNYGVVMMSLWSWNACNIVEVLVYALARPAEDKMNALLSSLYFISSIFRTMVILKYAESIAYPCYIAFRWASMPIVDAVSRVKLCCRALCQQDTTHKPNVKLILNDLGYGSATTLTL